MITKTGAKRTRELLGVSKVRPMQRETRRKKKSIRRKRTLKKWVGGVSRGKEEEQSRKKKKKKKNGHMTHQFTIPLQVPTSDPDS